MSTATVKPKPEPKPKPKPLIGRKPQDFTGQRFGKLLVLKHSGKFTTGKVRASIFICKCDCGRKIEVASYRFHHQNPKTNCGCANKGLPTIHRREYNVWQAMMARCTNPKHVGWKEYGGRGISVCEEWKTFEGFLKGMGARPKGTSLDRFPDVNGNYEPGNTRWATNNQQAWNKRTTMYIPHPDTGVVIPAAQLAQEWGVSFQIMRYRMIKAGKWPTVPKAKQKSVEAEENTE